MKTILVPTDYSETARNAAVYAMQLAKETGACVELFHSYHVPVPVIGMEPEEIDDESLRSVQQEYMDKEVLSLKKKYGVELKGIASMGLAADNIVSYGRGKDLVVMGMRGGSHLMETMLGSVSTNVMRKTNVPVLLVPAEAGFAKPVNVMMACNEHPDLEIKTLYVLLNIVKCMGQSLDIVYIKKPGESDDNEVMMRAGWTEKLKQLPHAFFTAENKDVVQGIFNYSIGNSIGMLVIFPHKYGYIDRIFHKSASKEMAFRSDIPLLVLPEKHQQGGTWMFT